MKDYTWVAPFCINCKTCRDPYMKHPEKCPMENEFLKTKLKHERTMAKKK